MSNELMKREDTDYYALHFARSGYFGKIKDGDEVALGIAMSQAVVKIKAGEEIGIGAFASMNGFYISQNGTVSMYANLMAAKVKGSSKYNYKVGEHTNEVCEIAFYESDYQGESVIGTSVYTLEDAKRAGLLTKSNWKQTPKNMLFSRAMSNGVRWYCPDVFGTSVYTPEELEDIPISKPEPDFVIQPAPELPDSASDMQDKTFEKQAILFAKEVWIKDIVEHESYPSEGSPIEKVGWVNSQIKEKELPIGQVTIADINAAVEK